MFKLRAHRKRKEKKDDIWNGFGDDEEPEETTTTVRSELSNDVRVVLLGEGRQNQVLSLTSYSYVILLDL